VSCEKKFKLGARHLLARGNIIATAKKGPCHHPYLQLSSQPQISPLQSSSKLKNSWTPGSQALHVDTLGIYEKIEPKIGNIGSRPKGTFSCLTSLIQHYLLLELDGKEICCWNYVGFVQDAGYTPGRISF